MKAKLITPILMIICGLGIGWFAYQNLMWAVWGKHNSWYEYLGFVGCILLLLAGVITIKRVKIGTYLGFAGFGMMLFYYLPAVMVAIQVAISKQIMRRPIDLILIGLLILIPLLTITRLLSNVIADEKKRV